MRMGLDKWLKVVLVHIEIIPIGRRGTIIPEVQTNEGERSSIRRSIKTIKRET